MPKAFMVGKRRYSRLSWNGEGETEEEGEDGTVEVVKAKSRKQENHVQHNIDHVGASPHHRPEHPCAAYATDVPEQRSISPGSVDVTKKTTNTTQNGAFHEDNKVTVPAESKMSTVNREGWPLNPTPLLASSKASVVTSMVYLPPSNMQSVVSKFATSGNGVPFASTVPVAAKVTPPPGPEGSTLSNPKISTSPAKERTISLPRETSKAHSYAFPKSDSITSVMTTDVRLASTDPKLTPTSPVIPMVSPSNLSSISSTSGGPPSLSPSTSLSVTPGALPPSLMPNLTSPHATAMPKRPMSFPQTPLPLSPRDHFHPATNGHYFSFPPTLVRPVPTWGLRDGVFHPVPLRIPTVLRPDCCPPGVASPEEVPSPPGHADMPGSPLLGLRSPGHEMPRAFADASRLVDPNNNSPAGSLHRHCEEAFKGDQTKKSFKEFLESAKVRVEAINDGNGLKNPLLSPDKSRLNIDTGPLGFMTLEPFPACPVCGVKCDTPKLLQRHVRSHKEIKRYLCAFCGKGFNDTFDLKRHTRTHTGVRPYKCDACGKAFTQRCSLESHCRKIHGQTLPFSFNERRAKIYVCEDCGHSTSNLDAHFQHLRDQHPGHSALLKHHDRRQFKFGKDGEEDDEGEEVDVGVEDAKHQLEETGSSDGHSVDSVSVGVR